MNDDLEQLREVFLTEVDEETRRDNAQRIREWEDELFHNEALLDWREHDITKKMLAQARETYREAYRILAERRDLTEEQRYSLWAKQDAAKWLISLMDVDARAAIERIHSDIKRALQAA